MPPAFAIVLAFACNCALKSDGFYIGNPRITVVYEYDHRAFDAATQVASNRLPVPMRGKP